MKQVQRLPQFVLAACIIAIGAGGAGLLQYLKAPPPKAAPQRVAAVVSVYEISKQSVARKVRGFGTVQPVKMLELRPQVSGPLVAVDPRFQIGAQISAGTKLAQIDPRDFEIALDSARASVAQARFELRLEEGNQVVAKREWGLLSEEVARSALGEELALRKPHLEAKQAALRAARSREDKSKLDLERTELRVPFDALVLAESAEVGAYATTQSVLGTLVSTDSFYVRAQVNRSDLSWLPSGQAVRASVIQDLGGGQEARWSGQLVRILGDVEQAGRMAQVLIEVENPLQDMRNPLLLDSFVRVELVGNLVSDVVRVPQRALREGDVLWVVSPESQIEIFPVQVAFIDDDFAFVVGEELRDGMRVVSSQLDGVLEGMLVTVEAGSEQESAISTRDGGA